MLFAVSTRPRFVSFALIGWLCLAAAHAAEVELSPPVSKTEAASGEPTAVKALLICGGCCHDYQNQKEIISEGLSKSVGPIDWTIIQYAGEREVHADVYQSKDWIKGFDLVVHNECFGGVTDPDFVKGIVAAHVENQIPAMVIHCSMHSYRNSSAADTWRNFLGVTSVRHEKSKQSMLVEPTAAGKSHPVLASLGGENWETVNGELYIINQVWPGATVLATAFSNETNKAEPVIWTNQVEGTRVFGTTIGHHNETMLDPKYQSILADGWKWAMKQE
ncbi:ThuA domain-containing protein [Neorhodopirellula pilleata]|nr:ThuA domain-containing protein [Neorhodopirellula pilleata]